MAAGYGTHSPERDRAMLAIARLEGARQRLTERPAEAGESLKDTAIRMGLALIVAACVAYAVWQL